MSVGVFESDDRPSLTLVGRGSSGISFPIEGTVTILGRDPTCQVVLGSMTVSRRHARLLLRGEIASIEDLGSTGGTLLNGEPLKGPARLNHGDTIQIGECALRYSSIQGKHATPYEAGETILHQRDSSGTGEWALIGVRPEIKLRAILQIGRDLMGSLDLDEVLGQILKSLFDIFPKAERGFILLQEHEGFTTKATRLKANPAMPVEPSRTALRHVIGTGRAVLSADILGDDRFDGSQSVDDAGLRTLMCVPLRDHNRRVIGSIQIDTTLSGARFTPEDLDLLVTLSSQVGMAVDNARLRRLEQEALRQQAQAQAFIDAMLEAAPVAIAFLDPTLRYVRVNEAMAILNDRPIADHPGRRIDEVSEGMAATLEPILRSVAMTGRPVVGREVAGGKTGNWLCHVYPAGGPDGGHVGIGVMLEDVSAARRAQAALEESEKRYRLLFEANPHPMWVYDIETLAFLAVNDAAIKRYGYSAEEFLRMTIAEIRPPDDEPRLRQRIAEIGQVTYLNDAGWRHITKSGERIEVEISSHAIQFSGRNARLVLASDITQRLKAEAEVLAAKESAESANRAKDRFLAVLSHELRTPLTPVLLVASSLASDESTPPELRATMDMILRNVELEARLVDDLLDVAKIEHGGLRLEVKPIDLHETLREAVEICTPEIRAAGLQIEWALNADDHHAMADPARIRQAFWNLIRNAARFARAEGRLRIRTTNKPGDRPVEGTSRTHLVVEFIDDGIGITPDSLARIFQPFERGTTVGRLPDGGLGLGLAISRSIVEGHGGRLMAESAGTGLGATFRIEVATIPPPSVEIAAGPSGPTLAAKGLRVLAVEDNADSRRYLEFALRREGFEVVAVRDVESARAAIQEGEFGLLISDIQLPDGSGLELMGELSRIHPTPGIAISGYGSEDDVLASARAGFVEHLTKPITLDRLKVAIARALGQA